MNDLTGKHNEKINSCFQKLFRSQCELKKERNQSIKYSCQLRFLFIFFLILFSLFSSSVLVPVDAHSLIEHEDVLHDHRLFFVPEKWIIHEEVGSHKIVQNITLFYGNPSTATPLNSSDLNISFVRVLKPDGTSENLTTTITTEKYNNQNISIYTLSFQPDENLTGAYHIYANVSYKINVTDQSFDTNNNTIIYHVFSYPKLILFYNGTNSWDQHTNQAIEILPLIRPDQLLSQSLFTGKIRKTRDDKQNDLSIRNTTIYINQYRDSFSTELKPDINGVFSFSFPQHGIFLLTSETIINRKNIQHPNKIIEQSSLTFSVDQHQTFYELEKNATILKKNDNKLDENDQILDKNINLVYNKIQETNFYQKIFFLLTVILITSNFFLIYKFQKKEINSIFSKKIKKIERSLNKFYKNFQKNILYITYLKLKNILFILLSFFLRNPLTKKMKKLFIKFLNWTENHPGKSILLIYFISVFIKLMYSQLFIDPSTTADSYFYSKMGNSFFRGGTFEVDGLPYKKYPPLYSILISPSFVFRDVILAVRSILFINAILSSLVIFPSYLIAKEFVSIKKSILIAIIVSLLPGSMVFVFYYYSENIFYPLVLFTFYIVFLAIQKPKFHLLVFSGFLFGLCFLTKYTTVAIMPGLLIPLLIYNYKLNKNILNNKMKWRWFFKSIKQGLIIGITFLFTFSPWLIRNIEVSYDSVETDNSISTIMGYQGEFTYIDTKISEFSSGDTNIISTFFNEILIHIGYVILGCGIIFFILFMWFFYLSKKQKKNKELLFSMLILSLMISLLCLTGFHELDQGPWDLQGRYVEIVIPLIVISGMISLFTKKIKIKIKKIILPITISILLMIPAIPPLFGSNFSIAHIISFNNINLVFKNIEEFINVDILIFIFLSIIITISFYLLYKTNKKLMLLFPIILILTASTYPIVYNNIRNYQMINTSSIYETGSWLNENTKNSEKFVIIDRSIYHLTENNDKIGHLFHRRLASWTTSVIKRDYIFNNGIFNDGLYNYSNTYDNFIIAHSLYNNSNLSLIHIGKLPVPSGTINDNNAKSWQYFYIYKLRENEI